MQQRPALQEHIHNKTLIIIFLHINNIYIIKRLEYSLVLVHLLVIVFIRWLLFKQWHALNSEGFYTKIMKENGQARQCLFIEDNYNDDNRSIK